MEIKVFRTEEGATPLKLADVELHFPDGELGGLKLIGFAVWSTRRGDGLNVTYPARTYAVNGERRSFALLRPLAPCDLVNPTQAELDAGVDRLRGQILAAYDAALEKESSDRSKGVFQRQE
jgi:hypothetical protein